MKDSYKISIIFIILLFVIVGGFFAYKIFMKSDSTTSLKPGQNTTEIEPEENAFPEDGTSENLEAVPESDVNFSQFGTITKEGNELTLSYQLPDNPPITVNLVFDSQSKCDLGEGLVTCTAASFSGGEQANVDGALSDTDVSVRQLVKI
jgi:hypothetical protein